MSQVVEINLNRKHNIFTIVESFSGIIDGDDIIVNILHTRGSFISVGIYPVLASIYNYYKRINTPITIKFETPENCGQLRYAERMNFLSFLEVDYNHGPRRNANGRFIELRNLTLGSYGIPELPGVFMENFNLPLAASEDISLIVNELLCNMTMHSESPSGGFFYCQKYPQDNFCHIYIVDSGIGISESLKKNPIYYNGDNQNLLTLSLQFEVGNGEGRGHGLYFMSEFIKRNGFSLILISGENHIIISNGVIKTGTNAYYKGVILKLGMSFDIRVTMRTLMNEKNYQ